jgi:hypothetical protein
MAAIKIPDSLQQGLDGAPSGSVWHSFVLGGRTVGSRLLEDAYDKGREQRGQIERDIEKGKQRAESAGSSAGAPTPGSSAA